jgi:hypothetical protein
LRRIRRARKFDFHGREYDWLSMNVIVATTGDRQFLATALATRRERQTAVIVAIVSFLLFIVLVPFVRVPLPQMLGFIPSYEAALFFVDLITAALLFDQFARVMADFAVLCRPNAEGSAAGRGFPFGRHRAG